MAAPAVLICVWVFLVLGGLVAASWSLMVAWRAHIHWMEIVSLYFALVGLLAAMVMSGMAIFFYPLDNFFLMVDFFGGLDSMTRLGLYTLWSAKVIFTTGRETRSLGRRLVLGLLFLWITVGNTAFVLLQWILPGFELSGMIDGTSPDWFRRYLWRVFYELVSILFVGMLGWFGEEDRRSARLLKFHRFMSWILIILMVAFLTAQSFVAVFIPYWPPIDLGRVAAYEFLSIGQVLVAVFLNSIWTRVGPQRIRAETAEQPIALDNVESARPQQHPALPIPVTPATPATPAAESLSDTETLVGSQA